MTLPLEIQVPIIAAALAAAGYLSKSVVDWWQGKRKEKARTIAQLQLLQSLLNASSTLFRLQQLQMERLLDLLEKNHRAEYDSALGYEEKMERCYAVMNPEEREIHGIIRAYTQYSLRPINLSMSEWLRSDSLFRTGVVKSERRDALAKNLFALEIHLLLWNAKYEDWLPDQPHHALVYMDDEKKHGLGFPGDRSDENGIRINGTDNDVAAVLRELRG